MSGPVQTIEPAGVALAETRGTDVAARRAEESVSIAALLRFAIENKMPAAELKELVLLHERIADRDAAREFNRALAAFRAECPLITKGKSATIATKNGGSYSFQYAELDEIAIVIDPILAKHGLSYTWDSDVDEKGMLKCTCILTHENGHSRTSSFKLPTTNESGMSPQQKVGAADSFAHRRTLASVLGITTTKHEGPANEVDPTRIDEDQLTVLEDLVRETKPDMERFLKFLGVETLAELRAADYQKARSALHTLQAKRERERRS